MQQLVKGIVHPRDAVADGLVVPVSMGRLQVYVLGAGLQHPTVSTIFSLLVVSLQSRIKKGYPVAGGVAVPTKAAHRRQRQRCRKAAQHGAQTATVQAAADVFQRCIRLGLRLHRHRLFHLFQLGTAGGALCKVLFHQCTAGGAGKIFGVQGQQIADHVTFQFHGHFLLCGLLCALSPQ